MKMVRSACVIAALLVLAGRALRAQEPLFGSESVPTATTQSPKISPANGTWTIPVSRKGTTRLIRIVGWGPEKSIKAVELQCSQVVKPLQNLAWTMAKGDCLLRFKPDGAVGGVSVKFMVEAAALESSTIAGSLTEDQFARADQNPVRVMLILEGAKASASDAGSSATPDQGLTVRPRPALLIFLVTLVGAAIIVLLLLKYHPFATGKSGKSEFDKEEPVHSPRSPRALIPAIGKTPSHNLLQQQPRIPLVEPPVHETAVESTLRDHSKLLLDLSSKDRDLELRIQEIAGQCVSMSNQGTQLAAEWKSEVRNESSCRAHELESKIAAVQEELAEHLARQTTKLHDLFKDLPALADLSATARAIDKTALSRLEDNLAFAARQSALPSDKLAALQDESCSLFDAIQEFLHVAQSTNNDQAKKRFRRIIESATVVNNELFNLGQLAATQKHGFFVEMSLLEPNHLADDLAAALTRETMKLADPEGYYLKRLGALRAHACVAGIDLADLDVDAERRNTGLQQALAKLFETLGMTPIDPLPNDKIQASEHQVVQFVRRIPGVQPGAIAHTMARGLQRGGEVIRKASVLLYE